MIYVSKCILCGGTSLKISKTHRFISPHTLDFPNNIDKISYYDIRNWVLLNEILPQDEYVVIETTLCESCGMMFNNPRFSESELKRKYAILEGLDTGKHCPTRRDTAKSIGRGKRILKLIERLKDKSNISSLLDYGGADGSIMSPFAGAGYDCSLIDYVESELPDGIRYIGKDHKELTKSQSYGLISFVHVLEHVPRPAELLSEVVSHLNYDGLVYIEVPLGCWREWEVQKEPLTHLNFFSEESVFNLLSNVGLYPVYIKTKYQYVSGNNIWCINAVASKTPRDIKIDVNLTKTQIGHPQYYIYPFIQDPIGSLYKAVNKSIHKIRSFLK